VKCLISHVRWLFLSNLSEGGQVCIFKCGSRKEKYLGSECLCTKYLFIRAAVIVNF
jgi:hypothetical protein